VLMLPPNTHAIPAPLCQNTQQPTDRSQWGWWLLFTQQTCQIVEDDGQLGLNTSLPRTRKRTLDGVYNVTTSQLIAHPLSNISVMASRMWDGLQHDNESTNDSICLGLHHKHTRFMLLICKSITLRTNTLMQQSARIQIRLSNRISRYATWYYLNV
jgi:hypothetical protein